MKFFKKLFSYSIVALLVTSSFLSQSGVFASQGHIDPSFDTGRPVGFDGNVYSIAKQNNRKIVLGGAFTNYQGVEANKIIRLNSDGSRDMGLAIGSGFNGDVNSLAIQSDGKIIIGGAFSAYQGVEANKIIRLNTGGSIDTGFNVGSGFDGYVYSVVIQNDGKIIIGGAFSAYQGVEANKIIRLNTDGSRDTGFDIGSGLNNAVRSLTIQDDGKIIIGGEFTAYQGVEAKYIIRLDANGSRDTGFDIGSGFNSNVYSLAVQSDEKILVGGAFTTYQGVAANKIVRLDTDGSRDTGFDIGNGFDSDVRSLAIQDDGKIMVGGWFGTYQGVAANYIIRLDTDGSRDTGFDIGSGFGFFIFSLIIQDDGKIVVGGWFTTYQGVAANKIVRLNTDGSIDTGFDIGNGFGASVYSLAIQDDGKILVGGAFTSYQGVETNRIIRLNADSLNDTGFDIGSGFNSNVYSLAVQSDEKILVGGAFTAYQGISSNKIIRLNTGGLIDTGFDVGSGFNGTIRSLAIQDDGKIIVGGDFTAYQGVEAKYIIRLDANGSRDTGFDVGNGFDSDVRSLAIQDDGKIMVGGWFGTYQGVAANYIARLNTGGLIDTGFDIGSGLNNAVRSLVIQDGGEILVGGEFTSYQGVTANRIIRLNTGGLIDTGFDIGSGFDASIYSLTIQNDGKILVGGRFESYQETMTKYIARLNTGGSIDTGFDIGSGFNGYIQAFAIQGDEKIIVGGGFTIYNNTPAGYLTALYGDSEYVIIPDSTDVPTVEQEFLDKGYSKTDGDLNGSRSISLEITDGLIPVDLSLKNDDIKLSIPENSQFISSDDTNNYDGLITVPIIKPLNSLYGEDVISAFKVGSTSKSLQLSGGVATLSIPSPTSTVGDAINIYYSEDNGVTWYLHTTTTIIDYDGDEYINFTTNHFTDFAITIPADTTAPTGTIVYSPGTTTSENVVATITLNESGTITSVGGATHTFTENGTFMFTFEDLAGNEGEMLASVNWIVEATPPTGGGGGTLVQDECPESRDCSDSYYDNLCGKCTLIENIVDILPFHNATDPITGDIENSTYGNELNIAYLRAYQYGITTMPSIQKANIEGTLIRKDMAKMITNFAVNVLKKDFSTGTTCEFSDTTPLTKEAQYYAIAACRLGLMGYESDGVTLKKSFDPEMEVDRSQFGTILSRLLRGNKYNGGTPYYANHLNALKTEGIMTKIEKPSTKEMRGWVMVMMQRIFVQK